MREGYDWSNRERSRLPVWDLCHRGGNYRGTAGLALPGGQASGGRRARHPHGADPWRVWRSPGLRLVGVACPARPGTTRDGSPLPLVLARHHSQPVDCANTGTLSHADAAPVALDYPGPDDVLPGDQRKGLPGGLELVCNESAASPCIHGGRRILQRDLWTVVQAADGPAFWMPTLQIRRADQTHAHGFSIQQRVVFTPSNHLQARSQDIAQRRSIAHGLRDENHS